MIFENGMAYAWLRNQWLLCDVAGVSHFSGMEPSTVQCWLAQPIEIAYRDDRGFFHIPEHQIRTVEQHLEILAKDALTQ